MLIAVKSKIDEILIESYAASDKKSIKMLLENIKKDKNILKYYLLIENILNNKVLPQNVTEFLNENKKFAKEIDFSEIKKLSKKILEKETIELSPVYEAIENYIFSDLTAFNVEPYYNAQKFLSEYVQKKENIILEGVEFEIAKKIVSDPVNYYTELVNECIKELDQKIQNEEDIELKLLMYETKDKLYSKLKLNEDVQVENVIEMLNFQNDILKS